MKLTFFNLYLKILKGLSIPTAAINFKVNLIEQMEHM